MSQANDVIFDAPGPRAKRLNIIVGIIAAAILIAAIAYTVWKLEAAGQFEAEKWTPFTYSGIQTALLQGLLATIKVAITSTVLALPLAVLFALMRLSHRKVISASAGVLLEIFRGLPVLILIFAIFFILKVEAFWAVTLGLTVYNGMVMAEIIRAGLQAVPPGQREAAQAIGMRSAQVMRFVLMPQAVRIMMPSLVAQIVVILKDSALGFLVSYRDLLREINAIGTSYNNLLPAFIVGAALYVLVNLAMAGFARYLEYRLNNSPKVKSKNQS